VTAALILGIGSVLIVAGAWAMDGLLVALGIMEATMGIYKLGAG